MFWFLHKQLEFHKSLQNTYTDISMHNTSWAALCSRQMGVPLQWHAHDAWNQTVKTDIEDFYANFDALASFVDGLDFENHKYRPSVQNEAYLFHKGGVLWDENNSNNDELNFDVYVMQNEHSRSSESDIAFGWIHNRFSRWERYSGGFINDQCTDPDPNLEIPSLLKNDQKNYWLNQFKPGEYFLDVIDTKTGMIINSYTPTDPETPYVDPITHNLRLKLPFEDLDISRPDIAFKLWHSSLNPNNMRVNTTQNANQNSIANEMTGFEK